MGVAEYRLTKSLPEGIRGNLPSVEQIEAELAHVGGTSEVGDSDQGSPPE